MSGQTLDSKLEAIVRDLSDDALGAANIAIKLRRLNEAGVDLGITPEQFLTLALDIESLADNIHEAPERPQ